MVPKEKKQVVKKIYTQSNPQRQTSPTKFLSRRSLPRQYQNRVPHMINLQKTKKILPYTLKDNRTLSRPVERQDGRRENKGEHKYNFSP